MTQSIVDVGVITNTNSAKYLDVIAIQQSQVWKPKRDCKANIIVIGGGASGCAVKGSGSVYAHGGSAGGLCFKADVTLSASTDYTSTVGAGGVSLQLINSGHIRGRVGGNSTFTDGNGLELRAMGGQSQSVTDSNVSGSFGGIGSGGDLNLRGGNGGMCSGDRSAGGGGAVNVGGGTFGSLNPRQYSVSGGAGVGGTGRNNLAIFEGGKSVPHSPILDFIPFLLSNEPSKGAPTRNGYNLNNGYGEYGGSFVPAPADIGVGGFGFGVSRSQSSIIAAQDAGLFAGGGAAYHQYDMSSYEANKGLGVIGGNGGNYGGGGGAAYQYYGSGIVTSGHGGDGVIFIAIKEYL